MNPARVKARGMEYRAVESGLLKDYRLNFNKRATGKQGVAYANITYSPGNRVEGVLYRLALPEGICFMDPFEGYPLRYRRQQLPIETGNGSEIAWVYLANPQMISASLLPERTYLNHLLAGRPWYSDDYYRWLQSLDCLENEDVDSDVDGLVYNA